jgi:hypothetical protein
LFPVKGVVKCPLILGTPFIYLKRNAFVRKHTSSTRGGAKGTVMPWKTGCKQNGWKE